MPTNRETSERSGEGFGRWMLIALLIVAVGAMAGMGLYIFGGEPPGWYFGVAGVLCVPFVAAIVYTGATDAFRHPTAV